MICFKQPIVKIYLKKAKHYENKPIQIYWKFYHQKMKKKKKKKKKKKIR